MAEYQKAVQVGIDRHGSPVMENQTFRFKSKDSQSRKRSKKSGRASGRSSLAISLGIMDPMLEKAMMGRNNNA